MKMKQWTVIHTDNIFVSIMHTIGLQHKPNILCFNFYHSKEKTIAESHGYNYLCRQPLKPTKGVSPKEPLIQTLLTEI